MASDEFATPSNEVTVEEADVLLNLGLSPRQLEVLAEYRQSLIDANRQLNLTSITAPRAIDSRLIAESLAIVPLIDGESLRILDLGTGGGIPGLPLAVALPKAEVHLLDATAKKLIVLREIADAIGLRNVQFLHGRAEDLAHKAEYRGCYNHVVARAVARLPTLVELALPYLIQDGVAIFPKGRQVQDELHEATTAISALGGRLIDVYTSPVNDARFVRIEKMRASPPQYPRKAGIPTRQPIGVPAR